MKEIVNMGIKVEKTQIDDVLILSPDLFWDKRGFFTEIFSQRALEEIGLKANFVQENCFMSLRTGTLRGIHFQRFPMTQAKLVRCAKGKMQVVAVDLRIDSKTYKKYSSIILEENDHRQVYIPRGFGHGCLALRDNTVGVYKVDNFYSPEYEGSIRYDDPSLSIDWETSKIIVSEKDKKAPLLKDSQISFALGNSYE